MTIWFILFTSVLVLVFLFSILRYLNTPIPAKKRFFFISLRLLLLSLIYVAFVEPVIHFQRLSNTDTPVPVFIDVSASISLFAPESTVLPILKNMSDSKRFTFFMFGDSIRKLENLSDLKFSDKRSFFPSSADSKTFKNTQDMILLSDGNWSNANLQPDIFFDKSVYFTTLNSFKHNSFIQFSAPEFQTIPTDSQNFLPLDLEARVSNTGDISIKVNENGKTIYKQVVNIDTGYNVRRLNPALPKALPGKHLYKIEISFPPDTLHSVKYSVLYALPGAFSYKLYSATPTLDNRFIALSLKRRSDFEEIAVRKKADLLFLFDWNNEAKSELQQLKKNGIAVFTGCLPCSTSLIPWSQGTRFLQNKIAGENLFDDLNKEDLPPLSGLFKGCSSFRAVHRQLSAGLMYKNRTDTIDIIFNAEWRKRKIIALAARDFWRWDFWPMSLARSEEQAYSFSDLFINTIKNKLLEQLSDHFFVYPSKEQRESDSLIFSVSFPSEISISSDIKLTFSLSDFSRKRILDTSFTITNTGSSNQSVSLTGISAGSYLYKCTASSNAKTFTYKDTLYIRPDISEFMITGQNLLFLREIGQDVDLSDSIAISRFIGTKLSAKASATPQSFKLNRSWWMLAAIFLLFAIEWIFRRRELLD